MTIVSRPIRMFAMKKALLYIFLFIPSIVWTEEAVLEIKASSKKPVILGRVRDITFEVQNKSSNTLAVLEIRPEQPCEEPISLIRPLYGEIRYSEKTDEYVHEFLPQMQSQISMIQGLLLPGEVLRLPLKYRPYSPTESFSVSYALIGYNKIYRRKKREGPRSIFSTSGEDNQQVLLPQLFRMPQSVTKVNVVFEKPLGRTNRYCFCETLNSFVATPPYSLYKDWDSGKLAQFRVGEKQEGTGPDSRPAGWKFLDEFEVFYGDGMYTHGEFIEISPDQAAAFMAKMGKKYSMKKIHYFLDRYYYDLEPLS